MLPSASLPYPACPKLPTNLFPVTSLTSIWLAARDRHRTHDPMAARTQWYNRNHRMAGLQPALRKFAASALLCILVIASVTAPICPNCSKIEFPSSARLAFNGAPNGAAPDCDRDGCSCCGFQIVPTPARPTLGFSPLTLASETYAPLHPSDHIFGFYRPPRNSENG